MLGIGIGHRESRGEQYQKPYSALVTYLDTLDAEGVPAERRIISALGPKTLKPSRERSAGTHPYLTTPSPTRFARSVVGAGSLVAPNSTTEQPMTRLTSSCRTARQPRWRRR